MLSSPLLRLVYAHMPVIFLRSRPKRPRQPAPYARGELAFLVNVASYNVRRAVSRFVPTGNRTALGHIVLRNPLAPVTDLVRDFDQCVVECGASTIFLGTDTNPPARARSEARPSHRRGDCRREWSRRAGRLQGEAVWGKLVTDTIAAPPDPIHIFGASGSGTTTLAVAIGNRFGHTHLDTDDFFWERTDLPYREIRPVARRQAMLREALDERPRWVLSGSLCGWGDIFIERFDLAIFLHVPHDVRMTRIIARERKRYGDAISENGSLRRHHLEFIEWASKYDAADESMRSLRLHKKWMAMLPCRCIRIEGDMTTDERLEHLFNCLRS